MASKDFKYGTQFLCTLCITCGYFYGALSFFHSYCMKKSRLDILWNIFLCVLRKKVSHTVLEQHDGEQNIIFVTLNTFQNVVSCCRTQIPIRPLLHVFLYNHQAAPREMITETRVSTPSYHYRRVIKDSLSLSSKAISAPQKGCHRMHVSDIRLSSDGIICFRRFLFSESLVRVQRFVLGTETSQAFHVHSFTQEVATRCLCSFA